MPFLRPLLLALLTLCAAMACADKVAWTASTEKGKLVLKGKLDDGYYIYSTVPVPDGPFPTEIKPAEGQKFALGTPVEEPGVEKKLDPGFNKEVGVMKKEAEYRLPLTKAEPGAAKLDVTYQVCNDSGCLPPTTDTVAFTVSDAAQTAPTTPPTASTTQTENRGLLPFFLLALGAGFLALLTPCVFPMIPITVSVFTKQDGGGLGRAVAFCGGIVATFTLLGIVVSLLFGASGLQDLANNPWLNLGLAVLFVAMAFSLFGVFELTLPGTLANRVRTDGAGRYLAPILTGLVFSLTSFTCTMPFVGTLLVSAANGDILYPVVGMMGFSVAFAVPFFFLALFPRLVQKLPRSGSWLSVVKAAMGFLEIAAAIKFLSNVDLAWSLGWLTQPVFLALWSATLLVAALFLFRLVRIPTVDEGNRVGPLRFAFGAGALLLSGWCLAAINGTSLGKLAAFLPPDPYPAAVASQKKPNEDGWITDYDDAKAAAAQSGKPLFVDFTGVFCTNCRDMERNVFPAVDKELARFERAKLFTDRPNDPSDRKHQALKVKYTGSIASPQYAILTPNGELIATSTYNDNVETFRRFLREGYKEAAAQRSGG